MHYNFSFLKFSLISFFLFAFITDDNGIDSIIQKLNTWRENHPQEKVYVQLNQSFFVPGDTLYCKAYIVNAENNAPSSVSNIVYIDVTDNNNKVLKTLLLPVSDGIGWSAMAINNVLHEGTYHIRAYTNWMRNFDDDFFFDKTITVLNVLDKNATGIVNKSQAHHKLYFFPEGGQLVAGLPSRLAFKAIGANGLGTQVSGKIMDEKGTQAAVFTSGFGGMGSCSFTPLPQHNYTAMVKYEDGFEEKVSLPTVATAGYVLLIDNANKENINIQVAAKSVADDVLLIAQSNNKIQYTAKLTLANDIVNTTVSKKKFPTGIAQFTLFTHDTIPVAERLVFINHNDQLNIQTSLNKSLYGKREKVTLKIHVADELDEPINGSFSIAVTDGNTVDYNKMNEQNITTNLLLTADLKGYVENPNHYFTNGDSNTVRDLDNLLLTQGWRRFRWKEVLADQHPAILYPAEKSLAIAGKVTAENGKPQADATVTLMSKYGSGFLLQTQTDPSGNFKFDSLFFADSAQFVVQAVQKNSNKNLTVTVNTFTPPATHYDNITNIASAKDSTESKYAFANKKRWDEKKKYGLVLDEEFTLKQVTVTTSKLSKVQQAVAPSYNLNGPGNADQILTYEDMPNCHDLAQCLPGKLVGVIFKTDVAGTHAYSTRNPEVPMLINVDGVDMTAMLSSISNIPANDVQTIEVLRSGGYLTAYGTRAAGGVLVITTKKGDLDYNDLDNNKQAAPKGVTFAKPRGYAAYREFYSPDYAIASNNTVIPDLRSTIYWKPDIVTDEDGNATIEWYNADAAGKYNVIIEGIADNGRVGNTTLRYDVQ